MYVCHAFCETRCSCSGDHGRMDVCIFFASMQYLLVSGCVQHKEIKHGLRVGKKHQVRGFVATWHKEIAGRGLDIIRSDN